jgi:hypothetical protein
MRHAGTDTNTIFKADFTNDVTHILFQLIIWG